MQFEAFEDANKKILVYMNTGNLDLGVSNIDIDKLKYFKAFTYKALKDGELLSWNVVFGSVNKFLLTLSNDHQIKIAQMFIMMHYEILDKLGSDIDEDEGCTTEIIQKNMDQLTVQLNKILSSTDRSIKLFEQLENFVSGEIPLKQFDNEIGNESHHSKEMTFYRSDFVKLITIAVLCKLLSPIFGTLMNFCMKNIDNSLKELHCVTILTDILKNNDEKIVHKLIQYLMSTIKVIQKDNITNSYNAHTLNMLSLSAYAYILTRRFVSVDLYNPGGNLMTYIFTCTRAAITTQYSAASVKNSVEGKNDPKDDNSDEGNSSRLEIDSKKSAKTADIAILVKVAVKQSIPKILFTEDIDTEMYNSVYNFYNKNPIPITNINNYFISMHFGNQIGGAAGVPLLTVKPYMKLLSALQCIYVKLDFKNLIHLLSLLPSIGGKEILSASEKRILSNWNNSYEYRNCKQLFQYNTSTIEWDTPIFKIIENVVEKEYIYNTAPDIWTMLNEPNRNGQVFNCTELLPREIYQAVQYTVNNYN